jgi:trimethylamine--corrinoid protein Co-methyltransferase
MLSQAEQEEVHAASLQILEETGAIVRSAEARRLLDRAGAEVTEEKMRVRFPSSLIDDAVRAAPKTFILGARDPEHDLRIPSEGVPYVCTDGFPAKIWDHGLREPRPSTRADLEAWVRLADALEAVDFLWPSATPTDLPPAVAFLGGLRTSYENTGKHVQYQAVTREEARGEVAMACAVAGGAEENRRRPHFSSVHCIVAPLQYDAGSTEAQIEFARAGIPVVAMSMVSPGITGPATLAGSVALANAEVLGSLAISQVAQRGAPVFHCFVCGPLDMKSGGFISGSPEYGLLSIAGAEMARHYGLPSMMGGFGNTAKSPGFQLGYEKGITTAAVALGGCDLLVGMGGLDDSLFVSMEQLLLDAELWETVERTAEGLEVNASEMALDVIEQVGPRGQFLSHPHTFANFRRLSMPRYAIRTNYDAWAAAGKKEMYDMAHEGVQRILATHRPPALPSEVQETLVRLEKEALKAALEAPSAARDMPRTEAD